MKRRRKTKAKYIFRRFFIVAVMLGAVGGGAYLANAGFFSDSFVTIVQAFKSEPAEKSSENEGEPDISISSMTASSSKKSSKPSSKDESASEPEPPSEPEASSESEAESQPEASSSEKPKTGVPVSDSDWELLLVNSTNPLPQGYVPELETINDPYRVDARIADNVKRMFADAKLDGINLTICSAYRSVEKQTSLYEAKKQEFINYGSDDMAAAAAAATIVAIPGTSEHHTGLALDIVTPSYQSLDSGFENTPAFKWLDENAHKYGFALRFPKDKQDITKIIYEPWHYRYVGEYNATIMKRKGLCLEEYVEVIKQAKIKALAEAAKADETDETAETGSGETDAA